VSEAAAFPLSALVGADDMVNALVLAAIDRRIGGVLLRGEKGSGKTTAARGLAAVLGGAPFVELPLGATEDRVVGALDIKGVLEDGRHRFLPGLLAAVDGGVLYVDEVNLLADHLVDVLLDVAVSGVNRVERDGVSHVHPSRFVLIGSMNPEEGELRPQLLDRFGLSVTVSTPTEPAARAEAVRRRLSYDSDPVAFGEAWAEAEGMLATRLGGTRPAPLAPGLEERISALCAAAGAEGLRADIVICRAAAALAGWRGLDVAGEAEVREVAPLALAHRRRTPWDRPAQDRAELELAMDQAFTGLAQAEPEQVGREGSGGRTAGGGPSHGGPSGGPASGEDGGAAPGAGSGDTGHGPERPPLPPTPAGPARLPSGLLDPGPRRAEAGGTNRGRRPGAPTLEGRGRVVGSAVAQDAPVGAALAPVATITAALARGAGGEGALEVLPEDLRHALRQRTVGNLVVLAVDASGSMGATNRLAAARGAALALLHDAYQRRDRVALVSFRGDGAQVVMRPTSSTEVATARLDGLETGGRTPLAQGIATALGVAATASRDGLRPLIVLLTDGRATAAPVGENPLEAALAAAAAVRRNGVDGLVVDCEDGAGALGLARELAEAMGARYEVVPALTDAALRELIEGSLPG
jgi:magnesium chelatase subunit D